MPRRPKALAGLNSISRASMSAQDRSGSQYAGGQLLDGILHRQEPNPGNAAYWFRRVGKHPVFPSLKDEARRLRFDTGTEWNPFEFIDFASVRGSGGIG